MGFTNGIASTFTPCSITQQLLVMHVLCVRTGSLKAWMKPWSAHILSPFIGPAKATCPQALKVTFKQTSPQPHVFLSPQGIQTFYLMLSVWIILVLGFPFPRALLLCNDSHLPTTKVPFSPSCIILGVRNTSEKGRSSAEQQDLRVTISNISIFSKVNFCLLQSQVCLLSSGYCVFSVHLQSVLV